MYPDINSMILNARKARNKNTLDEINTSADDEEIRESLEGGENESKDGGKIQGSPSKGPANWKRNS